MRCGHGRLVCVWTAAALHAAHRSDPFATLPNGSTRCWEATPGAPLRRSGKPPDAHRRDNSWRQSRSNTLWRQIREASQDKPAAQVRHNKGMRVAIERGRGVKGGATYEAVGGAVVPQVLDDSGGGGQVAATGAERLGEGAHEDLNVRGGHAAVLARAPAGLAERADGVRLVEVEVRAVLLLHRDDRTKVADLWRARGRQRGVRVQR